MPSRPADITPDRRTRTAPPTTAIMVAYERMGTKGRRRLMWIGLAMLTAAVGVGLFGAALSFYRFTFVLVVTLLGVGFIFPQYGLKAFDLVPALVAKLSPGKWLERPDRRQE